MKRVWGFIFILLYSANAIGQGFTNEALELGIDNFADGSIWGGGISAFDWNYDGLDDIVLLRMDSLPFFYENNGNGFTRVYFEGVDIQNEAKSVNWVDINNDGNIDLSFNSYNDGPSLFVNLGDFVFENITQSSGIQGVETDQGFGHNWGDYDNDGFLDLFVANFNWDEFPTGFNKLFHNNGDLTFTDVSAQIGLQQEHEPTFLGVWADYNNDNKTDLFVLNDRESYDNDLYENDGNGNLTEVGFPANIYRAMCSMTGTVGDYDNDGYFDLYVTNTPLNGNRLYKNGESGVFSSVAHLIGVSCYQYCWGASWIDYDNDGWQDLFVTSQVGVDWPGAHFFFRNYEGTFESEISAGFLGSEGTTYTVARGDFNNDGFPDLIVNSTLPLGTEVFINNGIGGNYLRVRLQGQVSNRDAIGCRIESHSASGKKYRYTFCGEQFLSQNSQWQHFGLGEDNQIDSLIVLWPSGIRDVFYNVEVNQNLVIQEGGSVLANINITSGSSNLCPGESVQLSAGSFDSYLWSTGETTPEITVSQSDTIFYQASSGESVVLSDTLIITMHPAPLMNSSIIEPSCFGGSDGSIEVSSDTEAMFLWNDQTEGPILNNLSAGEYTLTVYFGNSCQNEQTYQVFQPQQLEADSISLDYVAISSNGCDNSFSASCSPQGGNPPYSFEWLLLDNQGINIVNTFSGDVFFCIPANEEGVVRCIYSDMNGCIDSLDAVMNINYAVSESVNYLNLWPNPVEDYLNVSGEAMISKISIVDVMGRNQTSLQIENKEAASINVKGLPSGSYFLLVETKEGYISRLRFLKK